jgi:hypothetical protein
MEKIKIFKKMIFRLSDGRTVQLRESDVYLSDFFTSIQEGVTPIDLVEDYLKKTTFKKVKDVLQKHLPTKLEELDDATTKQRICSQLQTIVDGTGDNVLTDIITNFDNIFHNVIHRIKFISDQTLILVLEFLAIECPERKADMLDKLPYLLQGCEENITMESLLTIETHTYLPYIQFIEKRSETELLHLAQAGVALGIRPLIVLVGCKLAKFVTQYTEMQFRSKFSIPEKFRDGVLERIKQLPKEEEWTKFIGSNTGF